MEDMTKGVLSEEALEEIAGGLKVDKAKLKSIALKVGVPVLSAAAVGTTLALVGKRQGWFKSNDIGYNPADYDPADPYSENYDPSHGVNFDD